MRRSIVPAKSFVIVDLAVHLRYALIVNVRLPKTIASNCRLAVAMWPFVVFPFGLVSLVTFASECLALVAWSFGFDAVVDPSPNWIALIEHSY